MDQQKEISRLRKLLEKIEQRQQEQKTEIDKIAQQLKKLEDSISSESVPVAENNAHIETETNHIQAFIKNTNNQRSYHKKTFEELVGGNIINKVGIIILVLGIGIFLKYAIDRNLISPLIRISLSYMAAVIIGFLAFRLIKNYKNFSAVLFAGAIAIVYFTTYLAHLLYVFIPLKITFFIMVLTTVFSVTAALWYNTQIIAVYGLSGAYAIPLLLGIDQEYYLFHLTYITIINGGIVAISMKRYWKLMNYAAFVITWGIFLYRFFTQDMQNGGYHAALLFSTLYFAIFLISALGFKLIVKEKYSILDLIIILLNSFLFFGTYYRVFDSVDSGRYLGLISAGHAFIYLPLAVFLSNKTSVDRAMVMLLTGLFITFLTIAIPIQFNGHWVTLIWATESCILLFIGYRLKLDYYKLLSLAALVLSVISLLIDWKVDYSNGSHTFLFNTAFMTSLFVIFCTSVLYVYFRKQTVIIENITINVNQWVEWILMSTAIILAYFAVTLEISHYFDGRIAEIKKSVSDYPLSISSLRYYKTTWLFHFTALYLFFLTLMNLKFIRKCTLGMGLVIINTFTVFMFFIITVKALNGLRKLWLHQGFQNFFNLSGWNVFSHRYFGYVLVILLLIISLYSIKKLWKNQKGLSWFRLLFSIIIWFLMITELNNLLAIAEISFSKVILRKTLMSILWGIYGAVLIYIGIILKDKLLRIAAIVLLFITVFKVVFIDLSNISTLGRTVTFVLLGSVLLGVSFMYQRFKEFLFGYKEDEKGE